FKKILRSPIFSSQIISIVFDEAHCISDWSEIWPEYKELGRLQYILSHIPSVVTPATLSPRTLRTVSKLLHLCDSKLTIIHQSSDCPNIGLGVQKTVYWLNSYADLAFLVPGGWNMETHLLPNYLYSLMTFGV
ncbi:hypothetical protein SERLA73DRAFT_47722, partial [Serpula lacrymans var. lacrymans S7.3]